MPKATPTPGAFCWFELMTTDQAAAKAFYGGLFGWTPSDTPIGPGEMYTIFRRDGFDAAAAYTMRPDQRAGGVPPHWLVYVRVESADEVAARAAKVGGTVLAAPFDVMQTGRMSVLQDPAGAAFAVWQAGTTPGTGITGSHGTCVWADLSTPDQVRCAAFYRDLFGWEMVEGKSMRPAVPGTYYHVVNRGTMIGGIPPAEARHPGAPPHWLLYFQVDDCDASASQARTAGASVLMPPMEMEAVRKLAVLADPQGATFALVQPLGGTQARAVTKATRPATSRTAAARRKATAGRRPATARRTERRSASGRKTSPVRKRTGARKAARRVTKRTSARKAAGRKTVVARSRRARKAGRGKK